MTVEEGGGLSEADVDESSLPTALNTVPTVQCSVEMIEFSGATPNGSTDQSGDLVNILQMSCIFGTIQAR